MRYVTLQEAQAAGSTYGWLLSGFSMVRSPGAQKPHPGLGSSLSLVSLSFTSRTQCPEPRLQAARGTGTSSFLLPAFPSLLALYANMLEFLTLALGHLDVVIFVPYIVGLAYPDFIWWMLEAPTCAHTHTQVVTTGKVSRHCWVSPWETKSLPLKKHSQ